MKYLNQAATAIFSRLLQKMNGRFCLFQSPGKKDLIAAIYYDCIGTPIGNGKLYSIAHFNDTPDGVFAEPEILLVVIDQRAERSDPQALHVAPQLYEQQSANLYQESIVLVDDTVFDHFPDILNQNIALTEQWLTDWDRDGRFD
ncbi:MAG: DUF6908 domain-containing protein [Pseudobacter sp.]|uniref:DUF6908 domain-containing protein n=1 Tax=Pseudobacter sp. TaxID=2045420 RepID=UPI003F7F3144